MRHIINKVLNGLRVALNFAIITGVIMIALGCGIPTWCTACFIGFLYGYNSKDVS